MSLRRRRAPVCLALALCAAPAGACGPRPAPAEKVGSTPGHVLALSLSPSGRELAVAALDAPDKARIEVWSLPERRRRWSVLAPEGSLPSTVVFRASGGLLVGLRRTSRETWHAFLKVDDAGRLVGQCAASSPDQPGPRWSQARGVQSIAELPDGRVATGGPDDSLAVWNADSCAVEWPKGAECCVGESAVYVGTGAGGGLFTAGEVRWVDAERGSVPLGPRRWSGPPWRAEPADAAPAPWLALVPRSAAEAGDSSSIAVDGSCRVFVRSGRVVVRVPSGEERAPSFPPGEVAAVAASAGCAVVAAVIDGSIHACRGRECLGR